MSKSLVIVESPAKSKTINKILGSHFVVKASMGHVIDLPPSKLGIDIENNFTPEYITIKGKNKILKELDKIAKDAPEIYLAPDPDREGEAIAWHIAEYLGKRSNAKIYRVTFNEITKKAVLGAFKNAGQMDMNRVNAQQARRLLDRLVGYKLSPFLWKTVGRGLSAGRVQSVAVRLVCEREEQINKFVAVEYWSLEALLAKQDTKEKIVSVFDKKNGEKIELSNQEIVDNIISDLDGEKFIVTGINKREKKKNPYPPFTTSLLQQQGAHKLGFTASKTMMVAQKLYEGIDIGEDENVGLITYMRTDSFRIATEAQDEAKEYILQKYGEQYVPPEPRVFKTKKNVQGGHEAIRPTSALREPDQMKQYLDNDQYRLYKLIWERFVASQMATAILDITTVEITAKCYQFKVVGSIVKFDGFLIINKELLEQKKKKKDDDEDKLEDGANEELNSGLLPDFKEGEELDFIEFKPEQHFTKPPPRFSEATLVKALEENGIGRPSTYAPTIKTIQDRGYIEKEERRFHPTNLGIKVTELLIKFFADIMEIQFTAHMEDILDEVELGDKDWVEVLREFYEPLNKNLEDVKDKVKDIKKQIIETDEICEECGAKMVLRFSKYGQFMACSKYPECKFKKDEKDEKFEQEISELPDSVKEEKCDKCGADMVVKRGRYGPFLACGAYPECKNAKPIVIKTNVDCPEPGCDGELLKRKTKRGNRYFYGCSNYPECKYITNKLEE